MFRVCQYTFDEQPPIWGNYVAAADDVVIVRSYCLRFERRRLRVRTDDAEWVMAGTGLRLRGEYQGVADSNEGNRKAMV